jgi:hypothetical protein
MDKVLSDNVKKIFLFLTIQLIAKQTHGEKPSNDMTRTDVYHRQDPKNVGIKLKFFHCSWKPQHSNFDNESTSGKMEI